VGKHAAPDGAAAHPLVAAALAQRAAGISGSRREDAAEPAREGGLGWPDPPRPGGGGLGWPGKDPVEGVESAAAEESASATSRRGWRRLFRLGSAA
jgi:hypothetical protein